MFATLDDVTPGKQLLPVDFLPVHQRPVGAAVHHYITLRCRHYVSVATGDALACHYDIARCVSTNEEIGTCDLVFPPVGQRHQPSTSCGRRFPFLGRRLHHPGKRSRIDRLDILRAAALPLVDERELVPPNSDSVTM